MGRSRYRSQPSLQRTGGSTPRWMLMMGLAAAIGVGSMVLSRPPLPEPDAIGPPGPAPIQIAATAMPAGQPAPVSPALDAVAPEPAPQAAALPPAAAGPAPQVQVVRAEHPASHPAPAPKPTRVSVRRSAPSPLTARDDWTRQRREYDRALQAYQDRERTAGFQWARQNKVMVQAYCRATRQRTPAFMEGCMDYLQVAAG